MVDRRQVSVEKKRKVYVPKDASLRIIQLHHDMPIAE